jgi:hypothetical protein
MHLHIRLIDFLEGGQTNLRRVTYLVLDEADRYLPGFILVDLRTRREFDVCSHQDAGHGFRAAVAFGCRADPA